MQDQTRPKCKSSKQFEFHPLPLRSPVNILIQAMAAAATAAGAGAKSGPRIRAPGKHTALADITNTGRPNPPRSIDFADVLKENATLLHLLAEKTKIIEVSSMEMQKLRLLLHAARQQNLQLARVNSQMLAELNLSKDRLKAFQHELACTNAVLKVKSSELEHQKKIGSQLQREVNTEETKAVHFKVAPVEARQIDNETTSDNINHFVGIQSSMSSSIDHPEPPQEKLNKRKSMSRGANKRKLESCEGRKDYNIVEHSNNKPHLCSGEPLHHEQCGQSLRRRSARLNPGSFDVIEDSVETLQEHAVVPSGPSSFSAPKLQEQNLGIDKMKALQPKLACTTAVLKDKTSELELKNKTRKQLQEGVNSEETQASKVAVTEAHQIDNKTTNVNPNYLAETQSCVPYNLERPEQPQEMVSKRKSTSRNTNKRKSESCEGRKDSTVEEPPQHHNYKRTRSARLNPGSCEVIEGTCDTLYEDVVTSARPSSNVLVKHEKSERQNDSLMMALAQDEAIGRRSSVGRPLRRAAEKVVSYKEIPVNVKMRRV